MSLAEGLRSDLTHAMKSGDAQVAETLRGLLSTIHNEEISKRSKGGSGELAENEIISVLQREARKRKEAADIYAGANRNDLESKEREELKIIEKYLPRELNEEEVEAIVKKVLEGGETNFGKVMGAVMKEVSGRADSKVVTDIVKKNLGGGE